MKPLEGLLVLEFSQYLAGPSAGLRLADLGARVIKIERPGTGDGCRRVATKNMYVAGESLTFHTINRNKESFAADLKNPNDLETVKKLIAKADVMTHNFRPGIMERLGLDYDTVRSINKGIVYGVVTGYGKEGPWAAKPGQDLLIQAMAGLGQLSGNKNSPPLPMGLAVSDTLCGTHLAQGILAALIKKGKTGAGSKVEVSLLESTIDFQFEVLTTYWNDGHRKPDRAEAGSAHAYLGAPYGVYPAKEGYLAISMNPLPKLCSVLSVDPAFQEHLDDPFGHRDVIMEGLRLAIAKRRASEWVERLEAEGLWCAEVLDYKSLFEHEGYRVLAMEQDITLDGGEGVFTTRCPIRIDGERYYSDKGAPGLGEDTASIRDTLLNIEVGRS